MSENSWRISGALLMLLLVAAQSLVLAHSYDHEPGSLQDATCTTCITAAQLTIACVDSGVTHDIRSDKCGLCEEYAFPTESCRSLTVRQRGPPAAF